MPHNVAPRRLLAPPPIVAAQSFVGRFVRARIARGCSKMSEQAFIKQNEYYGADISHGVRIPHAGEPPAPRLALHARLLRGWLRRIVIASLP